MRKRTADVPTLMGKGGDASLYNHLRDSSFYRQHVRALQVHVDLPAERPFAASTKT